MKFVKFTIPSSSFLSFLLPPPPPPEWCILLTKWKITKCIKLFRERLLERSVNLHVTTAKGTVGYFSGHGSLAIRFQGSLRKSHCKDEASQVGWITYLVDLLRYYYWLPGTQITFRDCRSSFVLFPTTFLEKAHDKHWYCNKERGRNKNCVPKLLSKLSEFLS